MLSEELTKKLGFETSSVVGLKKNNNIFAKGFENNLQLKIGEHVTNR